MKKLKLKQWIKDFLEVTPKEWVAVQVFCAGASAALISTWGTLAGIFGSDDSDTVKTVMKIAIGVFTFLAVYAQGKTKKK